jgi:hypothetical protein
MTALPDQPRLLDVLPSDDESTPAKPAPVRVKSKAEAERDGVKAIYLEVVGRPYSAVPQDHAAWTELKKVAKDVAEIEAFWRYSLAQPAGTWLHSPTIWQLKRKWNDIATLMPRATPAVTLTCALCGQPAAHPFWDVHLCDVCVRRWKAEAPTLHSLEQAHAAAHPEDVESHGTHAWVDTAQWFILKPGVAERVARVAATAWLLRTKQNDSLRGTSPRHEEAR